jgi:hypothetical protein
MKKAKKFLMFAIVFLILIVPALSMAASTSLVPCDNTPDTSGKIAHPCDFNAFMNMVNTDIRFILYDMVVPIAAIMFVYAGFLLITAGEETSHARTKAKEIFTNTVIGLIIAVAAFIIINTVLHILGYDGSWIGFVWSS